jgi:hypothetical protein
MFETAPYLRRDLKRAGFEPGSGHVGFMVDKVALGQVFSECLGFPVNLHSTSYSTITIIIWGWYNRPVVAAVPSGLSLTPLGIIKKGKLSGSKCNKNKSDYTQK